MPWFSDTSYARNDIGFSSRVSGNMHAHLQAISRVARMPLWKVGNAALWTFIELFNAEDGAEITMPITGDKVVIHRASKLP